jgi:hypothetical protein
MEQEGSDWQVLAVPIRANTRESQALLAGTRDGKEFVVLVLGVTYEGGTVDYSAGFTGSLDFYNPTGEVAITARFSGGELQDVEKLMDLHRSPGLNWDCFVECLVEIGRELLPQCVAACVLCAGVPIPYNPACWACAACIGGGQCVLVHRCLLGVAQARTSGTLRVQYALCLLTMSPESTIL